MKTDIQIAQEAVMLPITEVAAGIGVSADEIAIYGKYKAKISYIFVKIDDALAIKRIILTCI